MEKLKNILFNKVTIGAILLFVQLAWLLPQEDDQK